MVYFFFFFSDFILFVCFVKAFSQWLGLVLQAKKIDVLDLSKGGLSIRFLHLVCFLCIDYILSLSFNL